MAFENKGAMAATIVVAASDSLNKAAANYVCDGVADNVEIQAAIDALPAGGGEVVLLEGNYTGGNISIVKSKVTLRSLGRAIYTLTNGTNDHIITIGDNATLYTNIRILDLYLKGNGANQGAGEYIGIYLTYVEDFVIKGNIIEDTQSHGIFTGRTAVPIYAAMGIISENKLKDIGKNAIGGTNGKGIIAKLISNVNIVNNVIDYCKAEGIWTSNGYLLNIEGNNISNITEGGSAGIRVSYSSYKISIIGNNISGCLHSLIWNSCENGCIVGNTITETIDAGFGIGVFAGGSVVIEGNFVSGAADSLIKIDSSVLSDADISDVIVNSNICIGDGTNSEGIYVYTSDSTNNHIIEDVQICNNLVKNTNLCGIRVYARFGNINHVQIIGNRVFDDQVIQTQDYGIQLQEQVAYFLTDVTLKNNNILGNMTRSLDFNESPEVDSCDLIINPGVPLDLSGAATDIIAFQAINDCTLIGYWVFYTEASSADAGVNIRIGRYQSGVALDNDYFDLVTSEVSKNLGYSLRYYWVNLTNKKIAAGDTITVGTAGGKAGTGEVMIVLHIAEMAD